MRGTPSRAHRPITTVDCAEQRLRVPMILYPFLEYGNFWVRARTCVAGLVFTAPDIIVPYIL